MGYRQLEGGAWLDRKENRVIGWQADAGAIPVHQRSKPYALLLAIWLAGQRIQVIHSGLVSWRGVGVLLAGASGVGKTTLSLLCHRAGFDFMGDDYVGIRQMGAGIFEGLCLFHSVRLLPAQLGQFPELQPHAIAGDEKLLCYLGEMSGSHLAWQTGLAAIVFPKVAPDRPLRIAPLPKGPALLQLGYSSLRIPVGDSQTRMDRLAALTAAVPTYQLEMGPDPERLPGAIRELLEGAAI